MKSKRTISKGITEDQYGREAAIMVHGRRLSKRFPPDTPIPIMKDWRRRQEEALSSTMPPTTVRGTLESDIKIYIARIKALASWKEVRAHLDAWKPLYGEVSRWRITSKDVREAAGDWVQAGVAPKTVNHRIACLRRLYHVLDGKRAATPCDEVELLPVHVPPPVTISAALIRTIEANLRVLERQDDRRTPKARVRFMVLATTGCRPSELMRAQPSDIDLQAGVWRIRTAKGGHRPGGLALTKDMRKALRDFLEADAWRGYDGKLRKPPGHYSTRDLANILREAGWPKGVRVYQLRHNVGMTLAERGADLADISAFLGHTRPLTTRSHYVPVTHGRMYATAKLLEGRFAMKRKA